MINNACYIKKIKRHIKFTYNAWARNQKGEILLDSSFFERNDFKCKVIKPFLGLLLQLKLLGSTGTQMVSKPLSLVKDLNSCHLNLKNILTYSDNS